jgi:hypothetical protein
MSRDFIHTDFCGKSGISWGILRKKKTFLSQYFYFSKTAVKMENLGVNEII